MLRVIILLLIFLSVISSQEKPTVIYGKPGAPGFENRRNEPEQHGNRSQLSSVKNWPQRMAEWIANNNILKPSVNK